MEPADPHQRELTGAYAGRRHFFRESDADESGLLIGILRNGETVRGHVESEDQLELDAEYKFFGRWEQSKYGYQFVFDMFIRHIPHDRESLVAYLSATAARVGQATAEKLWEAFGHEAAKILTENPQLVAERGVMSYSDAVAASESLRVEAKLQDTKIALHGLFNRRGFPRKLAAEVLRKWSVRAPARIRRDPFTLLVNRFPGCSFARCDRLYADLGHPPERLKRQGLAAWHAIASDRGGHTWLAVERAAEAIAAQIAGTDPRPKDAIRLMLRAGWIAKRRDVDGRLWIAETAKAVQEFTVATRVKYLLGGSPRWPGQLLAGLSSHQLEILHPLLSSAFFLLLGVPGTGKTFVAAALIQAIVSAYGLSSVAVAAPTGKAAVRLSENLANRQLNITASTVHRLLGAQPGDGWRFAYDADNPLPFRFLVIDELSMLDTELASHLFAACAPGTNIVCVGDPYQLAPVGHGAPLRDFIDAGVPHGKLSMIERNRGLLVRACASIKAGEVFETCDAVDLAAGRNLRLIEATDAEQALARVTGILDRFRSSNSRDVFNDVQVLTARNSLRKLLNKHLQSHLNANGRQVKGRVFREGDKVICLKNSRLAVAQKVRGGPKEEYVCNGDMGRVVSIQEKSMIVRLRFPERVVRAPLGKTAEREDSGEESEDQDTGCAFDLAYCCTTHKYQGSECPVIIAIADPTSGFVASREWWYTAVSRARDLCILVGRKSVIEQQCGRLSLRDRKTFLTELLKGEIA
jgi:exodeoxyribonuclease V alpha subunit